MPQLSFQGGHGYLLAEHPTSAGRIYPNFGFFKFQLWTPKSWYLATGVPADICKWDDELLLCEPIAKSARKRAQEWRCRGTKRASLSAAKNTDSAGSAAGVPSATACCTPTGSPDVPHRPDNLGPRGTDTAAANAAVAARR